MAPTLTPIRTTITSRRRQKKDRQTVALTGEFDTHACFDHRNFVGQELYASFARCSRRSNSSNAFYAKRDVDSADIPLDIHPREQEPQRHSVRHVRLLGGQALEGSWKLVPSSAPKNSLLFEQNCYSNPNKAFGGI